MAELILGDRAQAEKELVELRAELDLLLAFDKVAPHDFYRGPFGIPSGETLKATRDRMVERLTRHIDAAEEEVIRLGHYRYCEWLRYRGISRGEKLINIRYTKNTDRDGWYWWEADFGIVVKVGGFDTVRNKVTLSGKARKRKACEAKATALYRKYANAKRIIFPKVEVDAK